MFELYLEKPGLLGMREATPVQSLKEEETRIQLIHSGIYGSDPRAFRATIASTPQQWYLLAEYDYDDSKSLWRRKIILHGWQKSISLSSMRVKYSASP